MKFIFLVFNFSIFLVFNFSSAKIIDVPFISQVAPGDWESTLNCGQTSYYMADKFLASNIDLNSDDIKKIDDFLYENFSDPIRNYNGYYTNTTKLKSIAENLGGYKDVYISRKINDFDSIKKEIDLGNMIIPLVRISMKMNKDGHFMLMTGFDDSYVYFNDPGKTFGKNKQYLIEDFINVWKSQNYNYLLLKNKPKINDVVDLVYENKKDETAYIFYSPQKPLEQSFVYLKYDYNNLNNNISALDVVVKNDNNILLDSNIKNDNIVSAGYGYGYGYGFDKNIINDFGGGFSNVVYLPDFDFKINYQEKRLYIPLEFNFVNVSTDISKYYFKMDYKINDGDWVNLFNNYNSNYYKYYVKQNDAKYYFRVTVCDLKNNCSEYKESSKYVYIEPASDMNLIGYNEGDIVLDRKEYFNICFDVLPDQILLIQKGTTIKLTPGCTISIKGILFAIGDSEKRISITSTSSNQQNYWSFIKFENSFGSFLKNVDISYGGYYYMKAYSYPQFIIDNSILTLDNVNFSKSMGQSAVYVQNNSAFYMLNSSVKDSKFYPGIYIKESIGVLDNNIIDGNLYGISLNNTDNRLSVINNKITNSYFYPVYGENIFSEIKDNYFNGNKYNIISQSINLDLPGEYYLPRNIYQINSAFISKDAVLNIYEGSVFKFEKNNGYFNVFGSVLASGTASNPIIFTSIKDDFYGGDTDLLNLTPSSGDWAGFNFSNSSKSIFKNCIFKYGGSYNSSLIGFINLNDSRNIFFDNSFFEKSYYAFNIINSDQIVLNNNSIKNNFYGINSKNSNLILNNNYYYGNLVNEILN